MSKNSLNIKGLQNGNSLEAQRFPSQSINNENLKRERETSRIVSYDSGFYNSF